jgi:hypothetical protein
MHLLGSIQAAPSLPLPSPHVHESSHNTGHFDIFLCGHCLLVYGNARFPLVEETRQRGIINASTDSRTEGLKSCLEFPIQASRDLQEENTNSAQDGSHNAPLGRSDGGSSSSSSNGLSRGST